MCIGVENDALLFKPLSNGCASRRPAAGPCSRWPVLKTGRRDCVITIGLSVALCNDNGLKSTTIGRWRPPFVSKSETWLLFPSTWLLFPSTWLPTWLLFFSTSLLSSRGMVIKNSEVFSSLVNITSCLSLIALVMPLPAPI